MMEEPLAEWLNSPNCLEILKKCAEQVNRKAKTMGLTQQIVPWDEHQELVNELWSFAVQLKGTTANELSKCLVQNGLTKFCFILTRAFINKLLDRKRTTAQSGWHAYYRHVRQVLSADPELAYWSEADGSYYASTKLPGMGKASLGEEDFNGWPPPPDVKDPTTKRDILKLARFFYDQVKLRLGQELWVAVKDLTGYVNAKFPQSIGATHVMVPIDDVQEEELSKTSTRMEIDSSASHDQAITEKELDNLARCFAMSLSERARMIFYLKYGEQRSLKDIAKETGFKGESGVSYQLSLVEAALRNLCLMWPGLSPEDMNRAMFEYFVGRIVEICKSGFRGRQEGQMDFESENKETAR
jgi:hypothetical protein